MRLPGAIALVVFALFLGACELLPPRPITVAETPVTAVAGFDRATADRLVIEADQAAGRGDDLSAFETYRAAGLAWPEHEAAWVGLRDTAARLGDEGERSAADFMVRRVRLYDGATLVVQREVNRALGLFIADGGREGTSPETLPYAQALSDYYTARLVAAGVYEPPDPFLNVEGREVPAVIGTGLAVGIYTTVLGVSASDP